MQTSFSKEYLQTRQGAEANAILRSCVHCGFCTATCPTYLLTGNELDSPRGRIYLIKEMLEGGAVSKTTQTHLDRCLTCQSCETTCPSNVQYHSLLNIGREVMEQKVARSRVVRLKFFLMRKFFVNAAAFNTALSIARIFKYVLPSRIRKSIPPRQKSTHWGTPRLNTGNKTQTEHSRKMIILNGCVQNGISPNTNAATARVLGSLGIQAIELESEVCCGALSFHLNDQQEGLKFAQHNIDLLCDHLDQGVEAIISTASGCGNFIKDYGKLLDSSEKSKRVVAHCKDISEILNAEDLSVLKPKRTAKLAFHCPCSLQHGQKSSGIVEAILLELGFKLSKVSNQHICCGSAGTYSILQAKISRQLQSDKIKALEADNPDAIATANIGCQNHLASVSNKSVKHWIEYVDEVIDGDLSSQ